MTQQTPEPIPTYAHIRAGSEIYKKETQWDLSYKVATAFARGYYRNEAICSEVSIGHPLAIFLKDWNGPFYRWANGKVDIDKLDRAITGNKDLLKRFFSGKIRDYSRPSEGSVIRKLFCELLEATSIVAKKKGKEEMGVKRSPVSVAKALHVLAPNFFPPWDDEIASVYGCMWPPPADERSAECYLDFMEQMKQIMVKHQKTGLTLKQLDEYNYAHFTKGLV